MLANVTEESLNIHEDGTWEVWNIHLPTPPHRQDVAKGQFLRFEFRVYFSLTGCLIKAKEPNLSDNLS